ncbi:MAG: hypothetical protein ACI4QX_10005 [Lachnospiraceae bacterium]
MPKENFPKYIVPYTPIAPADLLIVILAAGALFEVLKIHERRSNKNNIFA